MLSGGTKQMEIDVVQSFRNITNRKMKFGGGRDGGPVRDPEHCVGKWVVIRG